MSSNENNMINLSNYEEYFILYMDNELPAAERQMVEAFVAQHPALAEELEMLMSTKLSLDELCFTGKEELLSPAMKVATVDEALLLYIDNELPASDRKKVEERLAADNDYSQQHAVLMQTKLDASEKVLHPNKKELYRYAERVVVFKTWMRIAAAVILVLFGSLFFLLKNEQPAATYTAGNKPAQNLAPVIKENQKDIEQRITVPENAEQQDALASVTENSQAEKAEKKVVTAVKKEVKEIASPLTQDANSLAQQSTQAMERKREIIQFDVKQFTQPEIDIAAVKETLAHNSVTSNHTNRITNEDAPMEPAVTDGDFKNTKSSSAKGLFRKVTRFIGRNTGIGTADAGEEVLIGAVALKLK
ncbi:MAG TPA: hypothetical protein VMR70_13105 [Flavisolibacter sp.]|nr:hypothetical protein [Flavisolibacter sp.]